MATTTPESNKTGMIVLKEQSTEISGFFDNKFSAPKISPAQLYLATLGSKDSRATVRSHLNRIAKILGLVKFTQIPWDQFEQQHVITVIEKLKQDGLAPITIRCYLATIKGVCRKAWSNKVINTESYTHIKDVRAPRGSRISKGRALSSSEVNRLISTCIQDRTNRGVRDTAIVAVMVGCGLRRAEVVQIQYSGIIFEDRSIRIVGKGNKERINAVPEFAWEYLEKWIYEVRGDEEGPLFTRARSGDVITNTGLTPDGLRKILKARQIQSGWIKNFSPHDLRRTFASRLLDLNIDLNTVRDLMGHSSINTTQIYDHRNKKRLEEIGRSLSY